MSNNKEKVKFICSFIVIIIVLFSFTGMIFYAIHEDRERRREAYQLCLEDKPEYECYAMFYGEN